MLISCKANAADVTTAQHCLTPTLDGCCARGPPLPSRALFHFALLFRFTCHKCDSAECSQIYFRVGSCNGTNNGFSCQKCDDITCPTNQYLTGQCGGTEDGRTCSDCAPCPAGKRPGTKCNILGRFYCVTCKNNRCSAGQYRVGQCNPAAAPPDIVDTQECLPCSNLTCPKGELP